MADELNHRCRSNDLCVAVTKDGAAVTMKPNTLCDLCVKQLQRQLIDLPMLKSALRAFLGTNIVPVQSSRVNSTPEPSVPINLRALDLMDMIEDVICRAGGFNAQVSDLVRRPAEKFTVWSRGKLRETFLDGIDRALDIRKAWRKADGIIGLSRTWSRRHAPCPECRLPTLGNFSGEDTIHCSNADCGVAFSRTEYEYLCLNQSKDGR